MRVLGLISGTSVDGVDWCELEIDRQTITPTGRQGTLAYPKVLRAAIQRSVYAPAIELEAVARLDRDIAEYFAHVAQTAMGQGARPELIASHGQTLGHWARPEPRAIGEREYVNRATWQAGNGAYIAAATGIDTVSDFRHGHIAAGGEGAPLAPYWHQAFFGSEEQTRLALNLGGIGNLSVLESGKEPWGFDTGPANCLLDACVAHFTEGRETADLEAKYSGKGKVSRSLLERLFGHPFFDAEPPKSASVTDFPLSWLLESAEDTGDPPQRLEEWCANLTMLTGYGVDRALHDWVLPHHMPECMVVCGGGANHPLIMKRIAHLIAPVPLKRPEDFGYDNATLEAAGMALLGWLRLNGARGGMQSPPPMGAIYPGK